MTIEEIKNYVLKLGRNIGLNDESTLYPMFSKTSNVFNEGNSIYVENSKYYYVVMERGKVNKCYESDELEDVLYSLFESITFEMASNYELQHRVEGEDSRELIWKKQLELMEKVNKKFFIKCQIEIEEILKIAPFNDGNEKLQYRK